mgnify:CR=1 FL=1
MDKQIYREYVAILKEELQPAMGCTEPIAVAYCAALARQTLGALPETVEVLASANIIKNVKSGKMGKKDIIKIDGEMELDWDLIGYVDPSITVNIIRGGELQEKRTLKLPERIRGVLRCKNPRCITSTERELPQEFVLTDRERRVYRCLYCETEAGK